MSEADRFAATFEQALDLKRVWRRLPGTKEKAPHEVATERLVVAQGSPGPNIAPSVFYRGA